MQRKKDDLFSEKFCLLNSQENADEINWSSSEASDYENVSKSESFQHLKMQNRKRKRIQKIPKNMSNLNITIVDVHRDHKKVACGGEASPILEVRSKCRRDVTSPVFSPFQKCFSRFRCSNDTSSSPILTSKGCIHQINPNLLRKSPILVPKNASPKSALKVRKKLFREKNLKISSEKTGEHASVKNMRAIMDIDKRKCGTSSNNVDIFMPNCDTNRHKPLKIIHSVAESPHLTEQFRPSENNNNFMELEFQESLKMVEETQDCNFEKSKNSSQLAKKIRLFFDSHFSSQNHSQHSICESLTPKQSSKTSDDLEIVAITQDNSNLNSPLSKNVSPVSSGSAEMNPEQSKKFRYKKNGLAYRLDGLLKKQNAKISLWQHERFLAENSSFIIPKEENVVFRIQKVHSSYGCYLLEVVNVNDEQFIILINGKYIRGNNISADMVLKLYEPYKILDYSNDSKLIINVCKFGFAHIYKNK